MSKKLEKVLEYLINDQEDKAKELLHQVFIEKARSIHEELISMDEESLEELGGDFGDELKDEVEGHSDHLEDLEDQIEAEETMAEAEDDIDVVDAEVDLGDELASNDDEDMDMNSDMDTDSDMDMELDAEVEDDDESEDKMSSIEDSISKLEDALAEFKAEFEEIEAGKMDNDADAEEVDSEEVEVEDEDESEVEDEDESDDEEMDESWLNEFDDLEESVDLDKVPAPAGDEVGSGKFAKPESAPKSPVGKAPAEMLGAKPVNFDKGAKVQGFDRQAAPSSEEMKGTKDNRRKKAADGTKEVSKEGDSSAMLNKKIGAEGTKSPLSTSPRK